MSRGGDDERPEESRVCHADDLSGARPRQGSVGQAMGADLGDAGDPTERTTWAHIAHAEA